MTNLQSRWSDTTPVQCEGCGWQGMIKDSKHGFKGFPIRGEDVERQVYCPVCLSPRLIRLEGREAVLV